MNTPDPPDSVPPGILPPRRDYRLLLSYQKSEVIYDLTYRFTELHLNRGDRTIDQMVQAARSCKQNILEGSKAALTSTESELKLTNVARASLEELLADFGDFLRVRKQTCWHKDSLEARYVRKLGCRTPQTFAIYSHLVETRPAPVVANLAICLIHQANFLLDRQLQSLERAFLQHGGLRERMTHARLAYRKRNPSS